MVGPSTEFRLERLDSVALVTMDDGSGESRPNVLGRAALESLADLVPELEQGDFAALVLADDWAAAEEEARSTVELGAAEAESPIGRYAGSLALLILGRDAEAQPLAGSLRGRDDFPADVADALATLAGSDQVSYLEAVERVLESFERRDEYLEDIPVADTVLVLQALAARRELAADLASALLPS